MTRISKIERQAREGIFVKIGNKIKSYLQKYLPSKNPDKEKIDYQSGLNTHKKYLRLMDRYNHIHKTSEVVQE